MSRAPPSFLFSKQLYFFKNSKITLQKKNTEVLKYWLFSFHIPSGIFLQILILFNSIRKSNYKIRKKNYDNTVIEKRTFPQKFGTVEITISPCVRAKLRGFLLVCSGILRHFQIKFYSSKKKNFYCFRWCILLVPFCLHPILYCEELEYHTHGLLSRCLYGRIGTAHSTRYLRTETSTKGR